MGLNRARLMPGEPHWCQSEGLPRESPKTLCSCGCFFSITNARHLLSLAMRLAAAREVPCEFSGGLCCATSASSSRQLAFYLAFVPSLCLFFASFGLRLGQFCSGGRQSSLLYCAWLLGFHCCHQILAFVWPGPVLLWVWVTFWAWPWFLMLVGCADWVLWLGHDSVLLGSVLIWLKAMLLGLGCAD